MLQIAVIDWGRFLLTHTWGGFPIGFILKPEAESFVYIVAKIFS